MTEQQRRLFSIEWRALFDRLEAKGYTVTFSNGLTITNGINRMLARYERCKWHVELEKVAFGPEKYSHRRADNVIAKIEVMLKQASQQQFKYDLRLRGMTA